MTWDKQPDALLSILTYPESVSKVVVGIKFVATANTITAWHIKILPFLLGPPLNLPFFLILLSVVMVVEYLCSNHIALSTILFIMMQVLSHFHIHLLIEPVWFWFEVSPCSLRLEILVLLWSSILQFLWHLIKVRVIIFSSSVVGAFQDPLSLSKLYFCLAHSISWFGLMSVPSS